MNIHRYKKKIKKIKRSIVRKTRKIKRSILASSKWMYCAYVFGVSLLCILLSQITPNSHFRKWYYALTNKESINKGVEREKMAHGIDMASAASGQFITYYRYKKLGAADPTDIDPDAPMVAFTFDDGPSSNATQRILDTLKANYSHATFFVVGRQTEQFPELVQAIVASGCELGNHTADHKNLTELSVSDIEEQMDMVNRSVKKAAGDETTVIRPPYGAYDDRVMEVLDRPVILWDVDSEDWKSRDANAVYKKVLSEVKDGDIILMHDIYDTTADAVEILLPKLKERGYQIVSVSEMAMYKGKPLELGKAYGKISASE